MHTHHISWLLGLFALGLASCAEKPWAEDEFKKAVDSIEGVYEWTGCTWNGPEVDMDNDGVASKDFWGVFHRFSNTEMSGINVQAAVFREEDQSHVPYMIECFLPFQCYSRIGGEKGHIFPTVQYFKTYYTMRDNQICLQEELLASVDEMYQDLQKMGETRRIRQTGYAQLEVTIDMAVFDFATGTWVEAPIVHQFKRKHY